MATLIKTIKNNFVPGLTERWRLNNGLEISFWKGKKRTIVVYMSQKDVSDQIYRQMLKNEIFRNFKLLTGAHYEIEIDESLQNEIFDFIESIDVKALQEGKSY